MVQPFGRALARQLVVFPKDCDCGEARNKGSDSILMHLGCQMLRFPLEEQHHVETSEWVHDGACGIGD
jgi:hypothetical protein